MPAVAWMWRSENTVVELILSFHFLPRFWGWNSGLLGMCLHSTEPSCLAWICQKNFFLFKFISVCVGVGSLLPSVGRF